MPDCHDIVNETCGGLDCVEIEHGPPKRQISNLSLPKMKSKIGGACSNLVNSIVGAGIIGIPYALKESGLVAGVVLLVLASYFTDKSLRMLVELAHFHPRLKSFAVLTFEDLMSLPFGEVGSNFILASMLIVAYGAMVAYLLIIKDTVPIVMGFGEDPGEGSFMQREFIMMITSLVIIVPLSMQRDMSSLSITSAISVIADVILVFIVGLYAPVEDSVGNAGGLTAVIKSSIINYGFFVGFGVLTTAMCCQHSAFIVSGSLHNLSSKRWSIVTFVSMSIACVLCAILGITGYLGFLEDTQGDVLNNFEYDALEGTIARLLLAFTMFFTYPMEAFVARHVIMKFLYDGDMDGDSAGASSCCNRRITWTFALYLATLIPALIVDDLGPVLSITGSLGGCCLAYIAPGLVYLGINGDDFLQYVTHMLKDYQRNDENEILEAYTTMETAPTEIVYVLDGSKPWFWYPLLMPLWVKIAHKGSENMNIQLTVLEKEYSIADTPENPQSETIVPTEADYYISIFFVVFGVIACVAGLLSNLIIQIAE